MISAERPVDSSAAPEPALPPTSAPGLPMPRFTLDQAQRAGDAWGFNCGPASVAVILGLTPEEIRPHFGDFERKHYTNPSLMWEALRNLKARWTCTVNQRGTERQWMCAWPTYGLARVQWEGPWTAPGVPMAARYRHTHWVASCKPHSGEHFIFDINCMCAGGWVSLSEWNGSVVPWLLGECEPKASGKWHLTHAVEIKGAPVYSDLWDPHGDVERDMAGIDPDEGLPMARGIRRSAV